MNSHLVPVFPSDTHKPYKQPSIKPENNSSFRCSEHASLEPWTSANLHCKKTWFQLSFGVSVALSAMSFGLKGAHKN